MIADLARRPWLVGRHEAMLAELHDRLRATGRDRAWRLELDPHLLEPERRALRRLIAAG